jgi:hypothetical protein
MNIHERVVRIRVHSWPIIRKELPVLRVYPFHAVFSTSIHDSISIPAEAAQTESREETNMRVSMKAVALASALLWGGCMLLVGLINLADPSYGAEFLRMMSSVYPGADTAHNIGRVLLGTIYGFVDGAIGGCLFTWLYRLFVHEGTTAHSS